MSYPQLPKWPACAIIGDQVTELQAAEIIFKTDYALPNFKWAGNEVEYGDKLTKLFSPTDYWIVIEQIRENLGILSLEYLTTQRILSSYVGGPNGWINWDGTIHQTNKNIGKGPDCGTVLKEWELIAKEFPFLTLTCQLFDKEYCEEESSPVVEFYISKGKVTMGKPIKEIILTSGEFRGWDTKAEKGISYEDLVSKVWDVWPNFGSLTTIEETQK